MVYLNIVSNYFIELEFATRETRIHKLNKNDIKPELAGCHGSTSQELCIMQQIVKKTKTYEKGHFYNFQESNLFEGHCNKPEIYQFVTVKLI